MWILSALDLMAGGFLFAPTGTLGLAIVLAVARLSPLAGVTCHRTFIQPRSEPVAGLIRPPTLDRPKPEFAGFAQGNGLVAPPDFVSMIGILLPIAPCGRSSL